MQVGHKLAGTDANTEQPKHTPLVIAGTSNGLLFLNSEQHVELEGYSISDLAFSQEGLWAIANRNSVWHRNSNGEWHQVALMNDLQLNCILSIKGAILVGTSGACLLQIADGSTTRINCFESVEGREEWYTPWGAPPDVRSLAVGQSGELYVNVHVGGILRSYDRGQSWQPTINIDADVHEVRTVPNYPDLVLAATAQGLAMSQDRGNNWSFDRTNLHSDYSRAVAVCGETILMTASTGPRTTKAAIYRRSINQPGTFEKCERGLPVWFSDNINTRTLATTGNFAAFGTSDGQIFLSNDAGLTWQQIAAKSTAICCLKLY
ncbi:MAG: hypothetical protein JOZ78_26415 [Chroococcidiopsidaceae cyanobacterium CP_BM_ER_R8_30]|nr:hypothetical protein [Chroococcidiopsidaceae cyanobacterium CP_BM_ER_R8_30]